MLEFLFFSGLVVFFSFMAVVLIVEIIYNLVLYVKNLFRRFRGTHPKV